MILVTTAGKVSPEAARLLAQRGQPVLPLAGAASSLMPGSICRAEKLFPCFEATCLAPSGSEG